MRGYHLVIKIVSPKTISKAKHVRRLPEKPRGEVHEDSVHVGPTGGGSGKGYRLSV